MEQQQFKNHVRYYPQHHFVFYPILLILEVAAIYCAVTDIALRKVWIFIAILIFLIGWLSFMLRQHYALKIQDRLVRLEVRHKYSMLTGKDFEPLENQLSFGQIAALRFASDEEFVKLIHKAIKDQLKPVDIKKAIQRWKGDHMRV